MAVAGSKAESQSTDSPQLSTVKFAAVPINGFPFRAVLQEASPVQDTSKTRWGLSKEKRSKSEEGAPTQGLNGILRQSPATLEPQDEAALDNRPSSSGNGEPTGRRSVQFLRPNYGNGEAKAPGRSNPADVGLADQAIKDWRGVSLLSKLRAFTSSSSSTPRSHAHARSPSGYTIGGESIDTHYDIFTPESNVPPSSYADSPHDYFAPSADNSDADSEESAEEQANAAASAKARRRRKSRRPLDAGAQTAPTTPKTPFIRERPNIFPFHSQASNERSPQPGFLPRRSTMTDLPSADRHIASEDEGGERVASESPWRRAHVLRGMSSNRIRKSHQRTDSETNKPSRLRRALSGIDGPGEPGEVSLWRLRGERTASLSASKWRQIKAGLKMIGRQRRVENTIDHAKSAELLAELSAGIPAALMLASMFQRDEHGNKRIPILLEQLKVKLTDSQDVLVRPGDRQTSFRLELEYGNGPTRMRWVIHRSLRDFTNLHAKYKLQRQAQKIKQFRKDDSRARLPRFPRSAFPFLRGIRGTGVSDSEEEEEPDNATDANANDRPAAKKRQSSALMRRESSVPNGSIAGQGIGEVGPVHTAAARRDQWPDRQRKKLEIYLQQMIRYVMFRPESNRLCKFLELSALGVRLAAEGSYHGKEGYLVIQSGKGVDFRRAWHPSVVKDRHKSKWFLVRHSYIVCVDSPEAMNIYDVFLIDSSFRIVARKHRVPFRDQNAKSIAKTAKQSAAHPQHHSLKLYNSERKLKLLAKHERQLDQFEQSIQQTISDSPWSKKNRFDSFAPVRSNVFAQWLVDGRDYMWNVSRAISMAKDVIYIHDWWLSPELYMRRPAAISKKWRLDRLLQKKAREGVKIFVIVYRNINSAIPIDSEYTKFSLLDLDPNIFVQRSPNQIRQGTFFWAHHEKMCVIDHMIAFVGGIDLCFGRWDTPQHEVSDDKLTGFEESEVPKDADHCQLWPGKDYSNPRVQDFYALDKPYEEMYNRSKVPRMPWHDIAMQVVGQPARDLTRHFVQRWNYILRQRKPTRPTPFLLPPPEFVPADLEALGLNGTCEVQILRSCGMWSMGTPDRTEHSIMTAYTKMIQQSEHLVYIENQFFVSTCEMEGTRIENTIGEALVERIIRANRDDEDWRAIIVIPLMPGFQNTVDSQDGTSVRLIMQCQFRSICRGDSSIFGRLRAEGIEPEDYIQFYSLRSWGTIGPTKTLVTEQLYIHAKCMIVDDQIAIIGSANINERSMLGNRDSELAAVVRDTDRIWSTMAGQPYQVGRFPHTLRMRLMREHLGVDVDEVMEAEFQEGNAAVEEVVDRESVPAGGGTSPIDDGNSEDDQSLQEAVIARTEAFPSFNHDADREQSKNPNVRNNKNPTSDARVTNNPEHRKDVEGQGADHMNDTLEISRQRRSTAASKRPASPATAKSENIGEDGMGNTDLPPPIFERTSTSELGLLHIPQLPPLPKTDDTDIGGPPLHRTVDDSSLPFNPLLASMKRPEVKKDCMRDPLSDGFYQDIWHTVAENNTALFRAVFRCMPDNDVKTWKEYKEYSAYAERFAQAQGGGKSKIRVQQDSPGASGPPGAGTQAEKLRVFSVPGEVAASMGEKIGDLEGKINEKIMSSKAEDQARFDGTVEDWAADATRENRARFTDASKNSAPVKETDPLDEKLALKQAAEKESAPAGPYSNPPTSNNLSSLYSTSANAVTSTPTDPSRVTAPLDGTAEPQLSNITLPNTITNSCLTTTKQQQQQSQQRRRKGMTMSSKKGFKASDEIVPTEEARRLLSLVQGHLIVWPYDWLAKEEAGGNWLYSIDQLAPLEI
ncbi:MAG: hypothetical protein LQ340_003915 [Diploschistes diacapsis]|nr:MAG: hypothetical protein LQ340_003915 [Diploschistes diacapsis]